MIYPVTGSHFAGSYVNGDSPPLAPYAALSASSRITWPADKTDTGAGERNAAEPSQRRDPILDSRWRIGVVSQQS